MELLAQSKTSMFDILPFVSLETLKSFRETNKINQQIVDEFFAQKLRNEFGYTVSAPGKNWLQSYELASQKLYVNGIYHEIPKEPNGYFQQAEKGHRLLILLTNGSLYIQNDEIYQKVEGIYSAIYQDAAVQNGQLSLFFDHEENDEDNVFSDIVTVMIAKGINYPYFQYPGVDQIVIPSENPVILVGEFFYVDALANLYVYRPLSNNVPVEYVFYSQLPSLPLQIQKYYETPYHVNYFVLDVNHQVYKVNYDEIYPIQLPSKILSISAPIYRVASSEALFILVNENNEASVITQYGQEFILNTSFQGSIVETFGNNILVNFEKFSRLIYTIRYSNRGQTSVHEPNYDFQVFSASANVILGKKNLEFKAFEEILGRLNPENISISRRDINGNVYLYYDQPGHEFGIWLFQHPDGTYFPPAKPWTWFDISNSYIFSRRPKYRNPILNEKIIEGADPETFVRVIVENGQFKSYFFSVPEPQAEPQID